MLPLPNLDDKTYEQIVADALKWIPRYTPDWTDHNAHDPGITLMELFAWLTELQLYYLDQIRSDNEWKFLKLLGEKPHDVKAASALVTVTSNSENDAGVLIERYSPLATTDGDVAFETDEPLLVTSVKLLNVVSIQPSGTADYSDLNERSGMHYAAFGPAAEAGSKLYLGFDKPFPPGARIPLTIQLYDQYPVARGPMTAEDRCLWIRPSAVIAWEYYSGDAGGTWKPLSVEADETLMLTFSGRLIITAPLDAVKRKVDRFPYDRCWIRATVKQSGYELPPKIDRILLNTVPVVQRSRHEEELVGSSNGLPGQYFELSRCSVLPESLTLQVEEKTGGYSKRVAWKRVDSLDASKPTDKHFVLQSETGRISFGDGENGAIPQTALPEKANNILAAYTSTAGAKGNVGAYTITHWVNPSPELQRLQLTNPLGADGGASLETLEDVKVRARKQWVASHSAATSEDYEALALSTSGLRVARAKAIPLQDRDGKFAPGVVMVVVVPFSENSKPVPSAGFLSTVCRHLHPHRLLTTKLRIVPPDYVKASVNACVRVQSGYDVMGTKQRVIDRLLHYLHPLTGGNEGTGWPFGRPIYVSELYDAIERVAGVDCVGNVNISASGKGAKQDAEGSILIPPHSLVYSEAHQIDTLSAETDCEPCGGCHGH